MKFKQALRALVFASTLSVLSLSVVAQITAIKAGKLVDPETGTTALNQIILVEKGKIKSVGEGLAVPADATVIDLSKATVSPGLFDAHTHLCYTSQPALEISFLLT
jgi:imidazolonepropionase-like amidohydrolase